jgi:hypothetical protein
MSRRLPLALLAAAVLVGPAGRPSARVQEEPVRIVAVGDVHGSLSGLLEILRTAGLIDARQRWAGGTARLVQTGDFTDRGDDVRGVIDLLMRLDGEARRAGGRVDVLFGNHEGMNVLRDLRDVSPGAFASFADRGSEARRARAFDAHAAIAKRRGTPLVRDEWMAAHPPGYVEYLQAFGPSGPYGRWIRGRKATLQVGDTVFMHAGLTPDTRTPLEDIGRAIEREIRAWDTLVASLERHRLIAPTFSMPEIIDAAQVEIGRIAVALKNQQPAGDHVTQAFVEQLKLLFAVNGLALVASDGPLWYRGFSNLPDDAAPQFEALVRHFGARRFVTGHTPQLGGITVRFGGRIVLIDTGMLSTFYKGGQPSALEIAGERLTAIYPSGRVPLSGPPSDSPVFAATNAH